MSHNCIRIRVNLQLLLTKKHQLEELIFPVNQKPKTIATFVTQFDITQSEKLHSKKIPFIEWNYTKYVNKSIDSLIESKIA